MNPYELMFRSGVMHEFRPISYFEDRIRYFEDRRMINSALAEIMPEDKTWQVALVAAGIMAATSVLFVRWWMCV